MECAVSAGLLYHRFSHFATGDPALFLIRHPAPPKRKKPLRPLDAPSAAEPAFPFSFESALFVPVM